MAPEMRRLSQLLSVIALSIIGVGCQNPLAGGSAPISPTQAETQALCAIVVRGTEDVSQAAAQGMSALAQAKIRYYDALETASPEAWKDNIALIRPAWLALAEIAELAGDDANKIDFPKFQADYADAIANESAFEGYSRSVCGLSDS